MKQEEIDEKISKKKLVKISFPVEKEDNKGVMKLTEEEVVDFFTDITKCPFCVEDISQFTID